MVQIIEEVQPEMPERAREKYFKIYENQYQ